MGRHGPFLSSAAATADDVPLPPCGSLQNHSGPAVNGTFEAHVSGVESDKGGLSHVAGKMLSKGFWVGGRQRQHLLVLRQRGENPAEEQGGGGGEEERRQPVCPLGAAVSSESLT